MEYAYSASTDFTRPDASTIDNCGLCAVVFYTFHRAILSSSSARVDSRFLPPVNVVSTCSQTTNDLESGTYNNKPLMRQSTYLAARAHLEKEEQQALRSKSHEES